MNNKLQKEEPWIRVMLYHGRNKTGASVSNGNRGGSGVADFQQNFPSFLEEGSMAKPYCKHLEQKEQHAPNP